MSEAVEGILPVNKPVGRTSFSLIPLLRRLTQVQKIGHAGTLDPFASGVMLYLIGKKYTQRSAHFLNQEKEYLATLQLGVTTDSYDVDGVVLTHSSYIPSHEELIAQLTHFQGEILQIPPMFSAKKVQGKKLYEWARKAITIDRAPVPVRVHTTLIFYDYPYLQIKVRCSKGTYIRSLAHDLGQLLGCGAHVRSLIRTASGDFTLSQCCELTQLSNNLNTYLCK